MKKSYLIIALAMLAMVATGCNREEVVRSFHSFRITESGFDDPDAKMHFTLASSGASGGHSKLCYDNGDKVLVNGHSFTLDNTGTYWRALADDGNDVEAANFYMVYNNTGMGISGSGPNYSFNYSSNFTGQVANANVTGVILAGSTDDSLLTLNPGCCILRFPADEPMDYVYVGFSANTIPKSGGIAIDNDGAVTITGSNYLAGVSSENAGEYLQMHTDGGVDAYYVAVPIKSAGVSTQLFFKWKYSASSDVYKFKTSGNVTLQKGYVYTVGKTRVSPFDVDGMGKGYFVVGYDEDYEADTYVHFSAGNLQCMPAGPSWRFADNQYDVSQYNSQIANSLTYYVDMLGWGTSGYDPGVDGVTLFNPWSKGNTTNRYIRNSSIAGTNSDWGRYIGSSIYYRGNQTSISWRSLTKTEWDYLINNRTNAASKWGLATINSLYKGLVLIPDGIYENSTPSAFVMPDGVSWTSGAASGYNTNTFTTEEWASMESAGAIFLPAGGAREVSSVININYGFYWTATADGENNDGNDNPNAYAFKFFDQIGIWKAKTVSTPRHYGCNIRLVHQR